MDNARRKLSRTGSYMLKITIAENILPLKDVEPVSKFAHLTKTICSLYREMQWIKMKKRIPVREGGIGMYPLQMKGPLSVFPECIVS